jgi:hypothetical protein
MAWEKLETKRLKVKREDRPVQTVKPLGKTKIKKQTPKEGKPGNSKVTYWIDWDIMMGITRKKGMFYGHDLRFIPTAVPTTRNWPDHIFSNQIRESVETWAKDYAAEHKP